MKQRTMRSGLAAAVALYAGGAQATPAAPNLGAPFPGATIHPRPSHNTPCGHAYDMVSTASLAKVADFYRAEGIAAGLAEIQRSDKPIPDYRMIAFARRQPHAMLFVILQKRDGKTSGSVNFETGSGQDCKA